jgi:hypothetical protein
MTEQSAFIQTNYSQKVIETIIFIYICKIVVIK